MQLASRPKIHPHSRGAYLSGGISGSTITGFTPLARGVSYLMTESSDQSRFTPTCVGHILLELVIHLLSHQRVDSFRPWNLPTAGEAP
jgi:hypothetical protein